LKVKAVRKASDQMH